MSTKRIIAFACVVVALAAMSVQATDTSLFTELSVLAGEGHFETDAIANFEAVLKSADRAQHVLKAREKALGKVIAKNRKHLAELKESEHHSAKKKAQKVKAKLHAAVKERTRVREKIGRKLSAKIVTRHLQKAAIKNKLAKVKDAHVKKALKAKLKSTRRHIAHENRDRDEIYWKNTETAEKRIDKLHQKVRDLKVATAMEQAAASRVVLKSALRTAQTDLHDAHAQLDKLQLGRQREQEMLLKVRLATTKKADKKQALQSSLKHVQGKIKRIEGDREKRFRSFEALLSKRARNLKSKLSMSRRSLTDAKKHGNKKAAAFYQSKINEYKNTLEKTKVRRAVADKLKTQRARLEKVISELLTKYDQEVKTGASIGRQHFIMNRINKKRDELATIKQEQITEQVVRARQEKRVAKAAAGKIKNAIFAYGSVAQATDTSKKAFKKIKVMHAHAKKSVKKSAKKAAKHVVAKTKAVVKAAPSHVDDDEDDDDEEEQKPKHTKYVYHVSSEKAAQQAARRLASIVAAHDRALAPKAVQPLVPKVHKILKRVAAEHDDDNEDEEDDEDEIEHKQSKSEQEFDRLLRAKMPAAYAKARRAEAAQAKYDKAHQKPIKFNEKPSVLELAKRQLHQVDPEASALLAERMEDSIDRILHE